MKKITITLILLIASSAIFAQETKEDQPKHEVGIDVLELIWLKRFEFSYDYLLNDSESIGAEISFFPKNEDYIENEGFQDNFSFAANYKHYFSKKYAKGFYIETFAKYNNGKVFMQDPITSNYFLNNSKKYNSVEAGFGIGYKYVSKRNFFIDTSINISRTIHNSLNSNNDYNVPKAISNIGITIGKRF